MTRLIDADALEYTQQVVYKKGDGDEVWAEWFITATEIDNAPTVDAEIVVRCEDCKKWESLENGTGICRRSFNALYWIGTDATDFCSFAERKDND